MRRCPGCDSSLDGTSGRCRDSHQVLSSHHVGEVRRDPGGEALAIDGEDPALTGGAAGCNDHVAIEAEAELLRAVEVLQVALSDLERQIRIGDDPVPVRHQVGLGHRRQCAEISARDGVHIDAGEAITVPRRVVDGPREQRVKSLSLRIGELASVGRETGPAAVGDDVHGFQPGPPCDVEVVHGHPLVGTPLYS
jgi:hypothetical protein